MTEWLSPAQHVSPEMSIPHPTLQSKGLKLRMAASFSIAPCKQATPTPRSDASTVTRLMQVVWISTPPGTPTRRRAELSRGAELHRAPHS